MQTFGGNVICKHHIANYSFKSRNQTDKLNRSMTKQTKLPVCPAKTQISLGIDPVWSVFAVGLMGS